MNKAKIMSILDKNLIHIGANCQDKNDCIKLGAKSFFNNGYVNEKYENAVIEREKIFPTGLPSKNINIAIPHTDPSNVIKAGIGVIIPNKPIEFSIMGTEDEKIKCDIIFPLAIKDTNKQIELLKKIMGLIKDENKLLDIKNAQTPEKVIEILEILNL